jgi:hypothetical protein
MPRRRPREVENEEVQQHEGTTLGEPRIVQSRQQPSNHNLGSAPSHAVMAGPSAAEPKRASDTGREIAPRRASPRHVALVATAAERSVPNREDFTLPLPPYIRDCSARPDKDAGSIGVGRAKPDWHRRIKLFLHEIAAPSTIAFRGVKPSEPRFLGTHQALRGVFFLYAQAVDIVASQERGTLPCKMARLLLRSQFRWKGSGSLRGPSIPVVPGQLSSFPSTDRAFRRSRCLELLKLRAEALPSKSRMFA